MNDEISNLYMILQVTDNVVELKYLGSEVIDDVGYVMFGIFYWKRRFWMIYYRNATQTIWLPVSSKVYTIHYWNEDNETHETQQTQLIALRLSLNRHETIYPTFYFCISSQLRFAT